MGRFSRLLCIAALLAAGALPAAAAECTRFTGSTAKGTDGVVSLPWRTDFPATLAQEPAPWKQFSFATQWREYMDAVLSTIKQQAAIADGKLTLPPDAPWWISPWLDVGRSGREALLGLTRERGPDPKDLSPTNADGHQVWAVGFYNGSGAYVLGQVFADPCDPDLDPAPLFPEATVSIKFLFTDAPSTEVPYLAGAPTVLAMINEAGSGSSGGGVDDRIERELSLLQVDIAVKDGDAAETGWVFGTYAWIGPPKGDGFYDNLVPVGLQWGNDPQSYGSALTQGVINPDAAGTLFGWEPRRFMGFNGRMNGPADNMRSSCISCHAGAQSPRSPDGLLGRFAIPQDLANAARVKQHVDRWFVNVPAGALADDSVTNAIALDYSLQLEAALFRICQACGRGDLAGPTPATCKRTGMVQTDTCPVPAAGLESVILANPAFREEAEVPPRQ